jgi:hypothetical protein
MEARVDGGAGLHNVLILRGRGGAKTAILNKGVRETELIQRGLTI